MKKYKLLNQNGEIIMPITIDENAKEDVKEFMNWNEAEWEKNTIDIDSKRFFYKILESYKQKKEKEKEQGVM